MEQASDTAGQLASAGLRIDFELSDRTFPVLDDVLGLVDLLPPIPPLFPGAPGVDDVLAVARARHLVSLPVGRGSVEVSARPAALRREVNPPAAPAPPVPPNPPAP